MALATSVSGAGYTQDYGTVPVSVIFYKTGGGRRILTETRKSKSVRWQGITKAAAETWCNTAPVPPVGASVSRRMSGENPVTGGYTVEELTEWVTWTVVDEEPT